jgi:hypothetical protein
LWNDPERRIVLESLRSFWIELGNELPTAGPEFLERGGDAASDWLMFSGAFLAGAPAGRRPAT